MKPQSILIALLAAASLSAQSKPETPLFALPYSPSLDLSSMDPSVSACVDFYHYACGGWIKKNPIPPDQARWDVYAKLTEENERFLWGILEQASKPTPSRSKGETEIGDYYHACMDEAAIDQAGAAPLQPELGRIAALKSIRDLPALLGRLHLTLASSRMLFGFGSNQDFADSTQVIAFAAAGGLGLPDRDYYTKTDTKSQEIRRKYVEHVQKMFELLGDRSELAKAHAATVMSIETALAKASLTRVERRDPYNLFHKLTPAQLQALTPSFRWNDYLETAHAPSSATINVTEPAFYQELENQLKSRALEDWKTYLRWHLVLAKAPYLSSPFVQANFDFYSK